MEEGEVKVDSEEDLFDLRVPQWDVTSVATSLGSSEHECEASDQKLVYWES